MHIFFVKLGLKCNEGKLFHAFTIRHVHEMFFLDTTPNMNKPIAVYTPNPKPTRTSLYDPI